MYTLTIYTSVNYVDAPLIIFNASGATFRLDARHVGHERASRLASNYPVRETMATSDSATLLLSSPYGEEIVGSRKFCAHVDDAVLLVAPSKKYWVEYIAIGYDEQGNQWIYSSDPDASFRGASEFKIADDFRSVIFHSPDSRSRYRRRIFTFYDLRTGVRHHRWDWLRRVTH